MFVECHLKVSARELSKMMQQLKLKINKTKELVEDDKYERCCKPALKMNLNLDSSYTFNPSDSQHRFRMATQDYCHHLSIWPDVKNGYNVLFGWCWIMARTFLHSKDDL